VIALDRIVVTDTVTTRPRCVDYERGEALHPPVDRDVIDVDAPFGEEFFNIAVRESVAEVPTL
jgi:hypothetical protein